MRVGVDGICTNFPERLAEIIQHEEFKNSHYLATKADDPFKLFCKNKN
jgi:hypothetical protein